jgi:hypothetical protein
MNGVSGLHVYDIREALSEDELLTIEQRDADNLETPC